MKVAIYDLTKKRTGEKVLPHQFTEEFRPDLIRRAVLAIQSRLRQKYGSYPLAGLRHSTSVSKRRRDYRGCYGFGISRVARKVLSRRGTRMFWVGAFSPQTVGGRRAHPPKSDKIFAAKINKKENRKAIRSALSATLDKELATARGHKVPAEYPFILDSSFEQISKTRQVYDVLVNLGFKEELARGELKRIRPGRGKLRGRKYITPKSILIVVSGDCPVLRAAKNVAGVDVAIVCALNASTLAPGALAGRVTLWTEPAITTLMEKKLFE